jgi:hypothetical protein
LANRQGRCCVCGELFTLKRITAKTCSPRCKKALQRNPDRYAIKEPPPTIRFRDDTVLTIAEYVSKLSNASVNLHMAGIGSELTEEQQKSLESIEAQLDQYRPMANSRYEFEQCAAICLVDHPEALKQKEEAVSP